MARARQNILIAITSLTMGFLHVPGAANAANVVIINNDGPGEGFNDPTPVAPVGGNPGLTLGAQRLFAFQYAADLWGQCLTCSIVIEIEAQMDPLYCSSVSATLGSASATGVHSDFPGAPKAATWYSQALANCLAGMDLNPGTAEITATFNSNLNGDPACLGGIAWYYGIDQNAGSDVDFVTVVAHEICHGLGFQTFQSEAGFWFMGQPDTYGCNMYHDGSVPPDYPSMTNAQRAACNVGDPNLVWDGPGVTATAPMIPITAGVVAGRVRLHAPSLFSSGSSLSHWSSAVNPNLLMQPYYAGPNHDIAMDLQLLKDTGWVLTPKGPVATAISFFDATASSRGVDVLARFHSDADVLDVTLYRARDEVDSPPQPIATRRVRNGDDFRYTDADVLPGRTYSYRIGVRDHDGEFFSPTSHTSVPVQRFVLEQNTPNPFNPTTTIPFVMPSTQQVRITVYDTQGRVVKTLIDEIRPFGPNQVTWDGTNTAGAGVASGLYIYRFEARGIAQSKKMLLMK